jgi:hypothetical protein
MASEKALYWMSVGLLALVAGNSFLARHTAGLRSVARRSLVMAEMVSGHATGSLGRAEIVLGQRGMRFDHAQMAMACAQTRLAGVQAAMARHEGELANIETERASQAVLEELNRERQVIVVPEIHVLPDEGTI